MSNGVIFESKEISNILCGNMIFNEAYFGKTKEILAAEQQLDKFRNKYMGNYVLNTRVNSDPELLAFDRMMEDIFGFGCFTMHVHNEAQINAFTQSIDYRFDYGSPVDNIIATKNGFKFKPEFDYACILGIYSGIIFNPGYTTPEVMAIILHEIGHNFNSAINSNNATLVKVFMSVIGISIILDMLTGRINISDITSGAKLTNAYRKFADNLGKKMRKEDSAIIYVYDSFVQAIAILKHCKGVVSDALNVLTLGIAKTAISSISILLNIFGYIINPFAGIFRIFGLKTGYTNEESADNFAAMYGYGAELATGLGKFENKEGQASVVIKAVDKIPVISSIVHINEIPIYLLLSIMDEHPHSVNRVKDQIELLKRELDKEDMDPKMVKYIKADIKALEAALDSLMDTSEGIKDPYIGMKFYNKMINASPNIRKKLYGGKYKFEEYDRAFRNNKK